MSAMIPSQCRFPEPSRLCDPKTNRLGRKEPNLMIIGIFLVCPEIHVFERLFSRQESIRA
jgi:hypothetical protein